MKFAKHFLLIAILVALSLGAIASPAAHAAPAYWPHRIPSVTPSVEPDNCSSEWHAVKNAYDLVLLCVTNGSKVDYATDGFGSYVRYKDQAEFTPLNIHSQERGKLIAGTDSFIYHHYDTLNGGSLYFIPNISESIYEHWTGNRWTDELLDVSPDETAHAIIPGNNKRTSWNIKSYALSSNSKYLVAQSVSGYIYKADLQTGIVTRVHNLNFEGSLVTWDTYKDGKALAISNDGRIVFMGLYGYFLDTQGCGEKIYSKDEMYNSYLSNCPAIDMAGDLRVVRDPLAPNINTEIINAYFDGDSYDIDVSLLPNHWEGDPVWKRISFGEIGQQHYAFGIKYLALGDSFSSGEGDIGKQSNGQSYYRSGTDVDGNGDDKPREKCHISERSYPYKLANGMGLNPHVSNSEGEWASVACSGAKTVDINDEGAAGYKGQGDRLKNAEYSRLKASALNTMIPGHQKQIEFVRKYRPQIITLTAGGNDVGFEKIIQACVNPITPLKGEWTSTCSYAKDDAKKANIANNIVNTHKELLKLYKELLDAGHPGMKLYVLGYPVFVDHYVSNLRCGLNVRLNNAEREMIVESTRFLNQAIMLAAKEAGAIYINMENSLGNHVLCGSSPSKAVNGITGLTDNAESFHPNELGHSLMALGVWDATNGKSLTTYSCQDSSYVGCPDYQSHSLEATDYFMNALTNQTKAQYGDGIIKDIVVKGSSYTLTLLDYMYGANQPFFILLYSNRTELGNYTTNSKGGFTGQITLPSTITPGYHTLEIESIDQNGEPLKLWKIIEVRSEDPNDYDGDGIPNNVDQCQYIQPANVDADNDDIDDGCDPEVPPITTTPLTNGRPNNTLAAPDKSLARNSLAATLQGSTTPSQPQWINSPISPSLLKDAFSRQATRSTTISLPFWQFIVIVAISGILTLGIIWSKLRKAKK